VAEREGFEPPIGLHLCRISSAVRSTTLPPLQGAKSGQAPRSGRVLEHDPEKWKPVFLATNAKTSLRGNHAQTKR
jgi:hypothetical protein